VDIEEKSVSADLAAGKTYTLFRAGSTADYYRDIASLADAVLERSPDIRGLITLLDRASRNKRLLRKQLHKAASPDPLLHFVVTTARDILAPHTSRVDAHLRAMPLLKRWDGTLRTSEEQYHLYMLLIELANRAWAEAFHQAERKIAFLPYCLRDLDANCRSAMGPLDVVCKGCSKNCFVNQVSTLLRNAHIEPYLWMNANLKKLLRSLRAESTIGVMGVACVPELLHGMRLCMGLDLPVIGLPLNANRCIRWMGRFHPTSVDLEALRTLIGDRVEKGHPRNGANAAKENRT
jgi:hypothetical protein